MKETTTLKASNKRLQKSLCAAVEHFRVGGDIKGLKYFLSAMGELEQMIEIDQNAQEAQINLNQLLPTMRRLFFYMQNQDIIGITDFLEDTFYPLTKEWLKGCDNT